MIDAAALERARAFVVVLQSARVELLYFWRRWITGKGSRARDKSATHIGRNVRTRSF